MSQVDEYTIPGSPLTMSALATRLENLFAAAASGNRGATAPDDPFEGMLWWDSDATPVEVLKRYTVTAGWVSLFEVDITTGIVSPWIGTNYFPVFGTSTTPIIGSAFTISEALGSYVDHNTWVSFGPTGGGQDHEWAALSSVPLTAKTIFLRGTIIGSPTANSTGIKRGWINVRKFEDTGGTSTISLVYTSIQGISDQVVEVSNQSIVPVIVTNRKFDLLWYTDYHSPAYSITLIGYM